MDYNIYKHFKLQALDAVLDPDDSYLYRKICRWYSTNFATPLHVVYELPLQLVLTNYFEASCEKIPHNDLINVALEDFYPERVQAQEQVEEDFVKALEAEQALQLARLKAKEISNLNPINRAKEQAKEENEIEFKFEDMEEP